MITLIIPSVRKYNGTGHIKRSLYWAEELAGKDSEYQFYLELNREDSRIFTERFPALKKFTLFFPWSDESPAPDRILMDNRKTTLAEWKRWEELAPVISVDEGGEARRHSSFLIDTFPSLSRESANRQGSPLYREPEGGGPENGRVAGSLLITFGGEDPAGMTLPVAEGLVKKFGRDRKTGIVQGPMAGENTYPPEAVVYRNPERLDELFRKYETVITSFGLTPYEARKAGCRVVLLNPTSYHEKLSRRSGFLSAGIGRKAVGTLLNLLAGFSDPRKQEAIQESPSVSQILSQLGTAPGADCPLCGRSKNRAKTRFGDRTFYHCRECGNYYLVNWNREEEVYDREYFFSRYKAQYGRTYLEDFQNIKKMSIGRLWEIDRCLSQDDKSGKPVLTDLGCAFGPFLAAAKEMGYDCRGVEINEDAARWIEENLSLPVMRGSLEDEDVVAVLRENPGEVTTLWYVIEHIQKQKELLAKLNLTLSRGGVLAFGTPSGRGVSSRKDLKSFLERSPADHYVIYTPRGARYVLSRFGFKVTRIKSVGHHPERFGRWVGKKGSFSYNVVLLLSRWFSLGDSLEAYAVKLTD